MLYREVSRVLGKYLFYFSWVLFAPLSVSIYYDYILGSKKFLQKAATLEFLETIAISFALSFLFSFLGKNAKGLLHRRESILLVVLIWLISAFVGALPFYLTKTLSNPIDAYFESMSGFTTTGSSVMCPKAYDASGQEIPIYETNPHVPYKTYKYFGTITPIRDAKTHTLLISGIEAVNRGVLFWRSFIQWLGGMGIVVLFLAILPALAVGGKFLFQAEVPGPIKDAITPRIKDTASILWKLYFALTIIQIYLLIWTNKDMPIFDAACITFSTLSTGGFGIKNLSIGSYNNVNTEWIVIIFMFIGSANFALYFHLLRRKFYQIYEPDFVFYCLIILLGCFFVSINLIGEKRILLDGTEQMYTLSTAIRDGCFQAVSAQSSTGFATVNYDFWPDTSQLILLILMFFGGMSGSTAGGIKTSRFYILFKIVLHKIESIFKPEMVRSLKIGTREIDNSTVTTVLAFFFIAIFFAAGGTLLMVFDGVDPETALGSIACMMNNIGLAFRATGPASTFALLPPLSKIISILWMLLGRLEFFAVLLLFIPRFWKTE